LNATDHHNQEQAARRLAAVAAIEDSISTIGGEDRAPDQWERVSLVSAISMLFRGAYTLALVEAGKALTPPNERSLSANLPTDPIYDRCDIALLRAALREAEAEPLRLWPHFGPIVFTQTGGK
jgi:hypothetical protein